MLARLHAYLSGYWYNISNSKAAQSSSLLRMMMHSNGNGNGTDMDNTGTNVVGTGNGSGGNGSSSSSLSSTATTTNSNNVPRLEPLTSIIRIGTMKWRPDFTKVNITPTGIGFHYPSFYQGALRLKDGASRNDLCYIKTALEEFLTLYNLQHPHIRFFTEEAIQALDKFAKCYRTHPQSSSAQLAVNNIEYYQLLLRNALREQPSLWPESATLCSIQSSSSNVNAKGAKSPSMLSDLALLFKDKDNDNDNDEDSSKGSSGQRLRRTDSGQNFMLLEGSGNTPVLVPILKPGLGAASDKNLFARLWTPQQVNIVAAMFQELAKCCIDHDDIDTIALLASLDEMLYAKDIKLLQQQQHASASSQQGKPDSNGSHQGDQGDRVDRSDHGHNDDAQGGDDEDEDDKDNADS